MPSPTPHTYLAVIAQQCTVQPCSVFAECIPSLSGTPPPPLPLPLRCTSTSRQVSSVGAAPSADASPSPVTPPRDLTMRGVTTQVSDPKINTACTTALNKNPYTRGSAPSLLRIIVILFHTALSQDKFLTTYGQSLSPTISPVPGIGRRSPYSGVCP